MRFSAFPPNAAPLSARRVFVLLLAGAALALADAPSGGDDPTVQPMRVVRFGQPPPDQDTATAPAKTPMPANRIQKDGISATRPSVAPANPAAAVLGRREAFPKPTMGMLMLGGFGGASLGGFAAFMVSAAAPGDVSMLLDNTDNEDGGSAFLMSLGATGIGCMLGTVAGVAGTDPRIAERGSVGWIAAGSVGGMLVGTLVAGGFAGIGQASGDDGLGALAGLAGTAAFLTGPVLGAALGYRFSARDLPVSVGLAPDGGVSLRCEVALR